MTQIVPLTALSIGYRVPGADPQMRRYRVHSRFRHALNLTRGDGDLLTLLDARYENSPAAIRVATPAGWDWRDRAASALPVVQEPGALCGDGWRISLDRAVRWEQPCFDGRCDTLPVPRIYTALAAELRRHVGEQDLRSALQLLPGWPAGGREVALALDDDFQHLQQQVARLVGFGTGLTPDGDDFLLGYLAVLRPWLCFETITTHHALLKQLIATQLTQTTDISRHYLGMALQGHFSEPITRLISAISRSADGEEIRFAACRAMQVGSASGADSVAGVIGGIQTLQAARREVISIY
jgi:Protein of unknown function (DUF2877)